MRAPPPFESTTRLVSRSLGLEPETLVRGFRRAQERDLRAVAEFRAKNFDDPVPGDDTAYLRWRYRFGRRDRGLGELWVLEVNGRLLGIVGTEDVAILHAGARHEGLRTMDILVESAAQATGLGVWINQAIFREGAFTLAVGANDSSLGTVRRLFEALPDMNAWILPVDIRWKLRQRWGDGVTTAAAAAVGNRLLRMARMARQSGPRGIWQVRPVERFDRTVDALFHPDTANSIGFDRGASFLNYRLFENPRARYQAVALHREGVLVGTIAWRKVARPGDDAWLHVIDWRVARPWREDGASFLLAHVTAEAERQGCAFLLMTRQGLADALQLRKAGYLGPREGRQVVVGLQAGDPALRAKLLQADWSLTDLDDDVDGT